MAKFHGWGWTSSSFSGTTWSRFGDKIYGTGAGEELTGTERNDIMYARGGDDTIHPGAGRDFADGGEGNDTAVFSGNVDDHDISFSWWGWVSVTDASGERDWLKRVEVLEFDDAIVTLANGSYTVTPKEPNDPPSAITLDTIDPMVVENDAGVVIGGLTVTDPDDATHTFTTDDNRFEVVGGELKLKADASLDYETEPTVNVAVTARDSRGQTFTETFAITVTNINDAPIASTVDLGAIAEDTSRTIAAAELLGGVTDDDGPSLSITELSIQSGNGTLAPNTDGSWTYTTDPDDDTDVVFAYTASDGTSVASATATLDITPVQDYGDGNDRVFTGPSNDIVSTKGGHDWIWTDGGNDIVDAGSGWDWVFAGRGDDTVTPGSGNDFVDGGWGTDTVVLAGNFAEYNIHSGWWGWVKVTNNDTGERDWLTRVEVLEFGDGFYYLDGRDDPFEPKEPAGPAITVPSALQGNEDELLIVADANGDPIVITGVDPTEAVSLVVTAPNGLLSTGAPGSTGAQQASFSGTTAEINAQLADLSYTPDANFNGAETLTFQLFDANTGVDLASATVPTTIAPVNDDPDGLPVLSDTTPTAGQEISAAITGISDVDGISGDFSYQWERFDSGESFEIPGAMGSVLSNTEDYIGQQLRVVVSYTDDDGTLETLTSEATAEVQAEDLPQITVPGAQEVAENDTLTFETDSGNGVSVSGGTAGQQYWLVITANNGVLSVAEDLDTDGDGIRDIDDDDDDSDGEPDVGADVGPVIVLEGTIGDINAQLERMTYTPNSSFSGTEALQYALVDPQSGAELDAEQIAVTVTDEGESFLIENILLSDIAADTSGTGGFKILGEQDLEIRSLDGVGDVNNDGIDDILIGTTGSVSGVNGAAYVVYGSSTTQTIVQLSDIAQATSTAGFKITGDNENAGIGVSFIGDIDGNGFADFLVSAGDDEEGGENAGAVYFIYGGASISDFNLADVGTTGGPEGFKIIGEAGGYSGISVESAGDVNNDGTNDLIVGAYGGRGGAYVVYGGLNDGTVDLSEIAAGTNPNGFKITGPLITTYAGLAVSSAGDINNDGYADVIVGAYLDGLGGENAGTAYVVFGGEDIENVDLADMADSDGFKIVGEDGNVLGYDVQAAGDVNGDDIDDLIVGAYGVDGARGAAYVLYGASTFDRTIRPADITDETNPLGFAIFGEVQGDAAGIDVSAAGDINGDGIGDLLVGALNNDAGATDAGAAYVVYGGHGQTEIDLADIANGNNALGFKITGEALNDKAGAYVSAGGDVNNDGYDDILIAAPNADNGTITDAGAVYVIYGGPANASAPTTPGSVFDFYVAGGTVYADTDGSGALDGTEVSDTTDGFGGFELPEGATGTLILEGGIDVGTLLPFEGQLRAPEGSTVITPLTTLIVAIVEQDSSLTPDDAGALIAEAFASIGFPANYDFFNTDPIDAVIAGENGSAAAITTMSALQDFIVLAGAAIDGLPKEGTATMSGAEAMLQVFAALFTDPDKGDDRESQLQEAAELAGVSATNAAQFATSGISDVIGEINEAALVLHLGQGLTGTALLEGLARVAVVARGDAAEQVADAARILAETGDPGGLNAAIARYTGEPLTSEISNAEIGDVDGGIGIDDSTSTDKETPITINVIDNDINYVASNPALTIDLGPAPKNGTVEDNGDGTITYTPFAEFSGTDKFTYTVTNALGDTDDAVVTVEVGGTTGNQPPTAGEDDASGPEGTTIVVNVLENDNDPEGDLDPTSVQIDEADPGTDGKFKQTGEGIWSVRTDGVIEFKPHAGFTGIVESITYTVADAEGNRSNPAPVHVTVTDGTNLPPTADGDSASGPQGTLINIDVLANDDDPEGDLDPTSVEIDDADDGSSGKMKSTGDGIWSVSEDGFIVFAPEAGFIGTVEPITYTVADAEGNRSGPAPVHVTVTIDGGVNLAPFAGDDSASGPADTPVFVDVLQNDSDNDGSIDPASIQIVDGDDPLGRNKTVFGEGRWTANPDGTIDFKPDPDFTGEATPIMYTVVDNEGLRSNEATVTVTIEGGVNEAPFAGDDSASGPADTPVFVDVLQNDSDNDGSIDPASIQIVDGDDPLGRNKTVFGEGRWTANPDGTIDFKPDPDFTGEATPIMYTVADNEGLRSNEATVTVTIDGGTANIAPEIPEGQSFFVAEESALGMTIGGVDATDPDDGPDALKYFITNGDTALFEIDAFTGQLTLAGSVDDPEIGAHVLEITVDDGKDTTVETVTVNVTAVNDAPTGAPELGLVVPVVGATLTVDIGNIDDADGLPEAQEFTYQWEVSDDGTVWNAIDGANEPTYTLTEDLEGKQVRVSVNYTDLQGFSDNLVSSSPTGEVAASAAIANVVLIGDSFVVDDSGLDVEVGELIALDENGIVLEGVTFTVDDDRFTVNDGILEVAAGAAAFSANQILIALSVAALSQANQVNENIVLTLLDGSGTGYTNDNALYETDAPAIDFNGDGITDALLRGSAAISFGSVAGLVAASTAEIIDAGGAAGIVFDVEADALTGADFNDDGVDDIAVANVADSKAYIVFGSDLGFSSATISTAALDGTTGVTITGLTDVQIGGTGSVAATTGDVNGDGIDDLIVNQFLSDATGTENTSLVHVIYGSEAGFASEINVGDFDGTDGFTLDATVGALAGSSVAVEDIDGDEIDDIVVSATSTEFDGTGSVYVVRGRDDFAAQTSLTALTAPQMILIENTAASTFGSTVRSVGDMTGDGIAELAVTDAAGNVYLLDGQVMLDEAQSAEAILDVTEADITFNGGGGSVSRAGDINGDGLEDIFVTDETGTTFAIHGRSDLLLASEPLELLEAAKQDGFAIAGTAGAPLRLGDANGDGFEDFLVVRDGGVRFTSGNDFSEEAAFVAGDGQFDFDGTSLSALEAHVIIGDENANILTGSSGNDRILAGAGGDTLNGGAGDDGLEAGGGDDNLFGGVGNDLLLGDFGNDRLDGGPGMDRAEGGPGADTFVFNQGDGQLLIRDFHPGIDKLELSGFTGGPAPLSFAILDSNGDGVLTPSDEGIDVAPHGSGLTIGFGPDPDAPVDVITILHVQALTPVDLLFTV